MVRSVLAALLLGIVPVPFTPMQEASPSLEGLTIAPPAQVVEINQHLSASGVIIMDVKGGQELFGKQVEVRRPMASLTKLMTALIIVENHDLDELARVTKETRDVEGNNVYLPVGERFTVGDLLSALLISSANDAAYVLAVHHSGTLDAFVEEMNQRAQTLGLKNTQYANPSGLDSVNQWSTPQDLAWLATYAIKNPEIKERLSKRGMNIYSTSGQQITLVHTHAFMHADTPVVAGKTGTTDGAKQCLLSFVKIDNKDYLVVLMYSLNRYKDMRKVLDILEGTQEVSYISTEKRQKIKRSKTSQRSFSSLSLIPFPLLSHLSPFAHFDTVLAS
ncbi:MAG: serine hydrolase [Kiritimatiellales bacterium]|nr:serine hydrolase [Kiritimatiellales bacterium]